MVVFRLHLSLVLFDRWCGFACHRLLASMLFACSAYFFCRMLGRMCFCVFDVFDFPLSWHECERAACVCSCFVLLDLCLCDRYVIAVVVCVRSSVFPCDCVLDRLGVYVFQARVARLRAHYAFLIVKFQ